ncbi:MAG: hypothetical protein ICV65_02640 [Flavisolibacter sp.]|nr:hypothetical protein [Flavisolibacter sp.]
MRVVFGRADSIFCSTSKDRGGTFSQPVFVGHVAGMHLGMTRGPQIASSEHYTVVTAMDKAGNIHYFQLTHDNNKWEYKGRVNDVPSSAPEGLMSIAADTKNHFYAVWLDVRQHNRNNICFSSLSGTTGKWKKNTLIYISPDEHVCECCKPSIAVNGIKVAVMYRNWLNGSRDLYVMASGDGGKTFKEAQKLGVGTWKLNGCPMDGGGIGVDNQGTIHTVWQREGSIYYCKPEESESNLIKGRLCSIALDRANTKKRIITLQDEGVVKMVDLDSKKEMTVGKGNFLKSIILGEEVLCVWEQDKNIRFRKVSIPAANTAFKK